MKIAIFGATGKTGLNCVEQALERGHQVTAFVRCPEKLKKYLENSNLQIVKCDIFNSDEIAMSLYGIDAVFSTLGAYGFYLFKCSFYSDSMRSIVAAMRKANIKRLICIDSFFTKYDPNYPYSYKFFYRPFFGRQLDNMYEMEQFLFNECQDIDFTIVRCSRLLDLPLKNENELINEDSFWFQDNSNMNQIPRANVARFMLKCLENGLFTKKGVAIDMPVTRN